MSTVEQIELFLNPRAVAIIGVSRHITDKSLNILKNLKDLGFSGKIYPINPNAEEILGIRAYHDLDDIAEDIDLAVIATPRFLVPSLAKRCVERGIKAIVVVAMGFADGDQEGKELQDELTRISRESGSRILGPNTFGTVNAFNNFSSGFVRLGMDKVPVGIICQSGYFMNYLPLLKSSWMGKAIDLGNACDVSHADGLEYFEDDPIIKLILLHVEGIRDGRRFMRVARRVARKKPIIAIKTGRSDEGAKMAQSHTGSLVGKDEVYDAAFKQCGIIRVESIEELEDLSRAFLCLPPMRGRRIGLATFVGGGGVIVVDSCQRYVMEVAEISPQTKSKIEGLSPSWMNVKNPLDMWPPLMNAEPSQLETCETILKAFLGDPNIDGAIYIPWVYTQDTYWDFSLPLLKVLDTVPDKPVICSPYGPCSIKAMNQLQKTGRTMVLPTPERAVRALAGLARYSRFLEMELGQDSD